MLAAGVMEDGLTVSASTGAPQGGAISPLPSNVYGHALDVLFENEASHLGQLIRYCDDAVILCRSETDARKALEWLRRRAARLHLHLHPEKTRLVLWAMATMASIFWGFTSAWLVSHRYGRR